MEPLDALCVGLYLCRDLTPGVGGRGSLHQHRQPQRGKGYGGAIHSQPFGSGPRQ